MDGDKQGQPAPVPEVSARDLQKQLDETNQAMWALYKELDDKNAELERSNSELDQFAMIAGHDLQEPLRKVVAFGDRLGAEYADALDERGRDYIDRMQGASSRMLGLISDLLRYARITSQARPFEPCDLNEIAAGAVSDLEERIVRENGQVESGSLPTIDADPIQMHQLLLNLIGNGLKFHPPDRTPRVVVSCADIGDGTVALSVADNGIGFKEQFVERIFQPFRRLHGKGSYEGTGMGLAICRKIAIRHGGDLSATSEVGAGSTFVITIPVAQPRSERPEARPEP
ncbi:MAG: ATP-binding protein [Alphaproteobacteria bacterium]|jgi:light-regulated signal transduction histidine kinase (bacteriophytochrome)|nr:ATP-binding protein [Alphaproteobacteria bacterium]MDP6515342.1 ATP-binding protein [Alphaproteobacteria bacterium]